MLIHCVHFDKRKDREELFQKEASEQGFEFTFHEPLPHLHPWVSLRMTMQKIVQDNLEQPEIILMEDDVKFCDTGAFDYFLAGRPEQYDIYISGFYDGRINEETRRIVRSWSGLHCISVHKRFYQKLLSCDTEEHFDRWMFNQGAEIYSSYPFAAIQHVTYSDIQQRHSDHSWFLQRKQLFKQQTPQVTGLIVT